ncbi:MAG: double-strand break repair protein AddB [Rhizobiales bacterium]|nr:double-strand break repair protein AddB [Hyphomicrobiales bacterium]
MADDSLTLFTMPPGTPFLDRLAGTLLADPTLGGRWGADVALADITILLPTRRAVRAMADAFLRAGDGTALILPMIGPIGDVDEDELLLDPTGLAEEALDLPPSMPGLMRQMLLARLIMARWQAEGETGEPDAIRAVALAADLGSFLDMGITEGVKFEGLRDIVPDDYALNWQLTLEFLSILTSAWPEELARLGYIEQTERRNLLLDAQVARWKVAPPAGPVIAAGSTGSIPASARLLTAVAGLEKGALVLPGLDLLLDARSWDAIGPAETASHPQYGMKKLLTGMGATRGDVKLWPGVTPEPTPRQRLLSEALRPAATTDGWLDVLPDLKPVAAEAIRGLRLVEAATERDEAGAIAMLMRETLQAPLRTAALVTPDRNLARRVAMELQRWDIAVDDSGGTPLSHRPPLVYLRLLAEVVAEEFAPVELLAFLKHPLTACGQSTVQTRQQARLLEKALLRGPRPAPGIAGLRAALHEWHLAHESDGRRFGELSGFIDRLERGFAPLIEAMSPRTCDPENLAGAHIESAELLATTDTEKGEARLWGQEDGEAAALFMRELGGSVAHLGAVAPRIWPRLVGDLSASQVVRPRFGRHPRLFIWGPLEARMLHADRMILGGLNEGTWPGIANIDPWLNRPMRTGLGLEPPERRIGLSAHDFVEAACASDVILTRAQKVEGTPTVASRWLLRLTSLLEGLGMPDALKAGEWVHFAQKIDEAKVVTPAPKPRPTPAVTLRPEKFSVTEIETLLRDPYAIYAKKILGLPVLDPIDADVAAADRGNIIHKALEDFVRAYPAALPENARDELRRIGQESFAHAMGRPGVAAFWWPRFLRIMDWFLAFEAEHRKTIQLAHAEIRGSIVLSELARPVTLTGKADRIDLRRDGKVVIMDYKTGRVPSEKEIKSGLAPQLPLEAAMVARGGFAELGRVQAASLVHLRLTGAEKAGEEKAIPDEDGALAEQTYGSLIKTLSSYEKPEIPYLSRVRPRFEAGLGDYDHLARTRETSASGEGGE